MSNSHDSKSELCASEIGKICSELRLLGIDAEESPSSRPEQTALGRSSLGLINIAQGPIQWVNIRNVKGGDDPDYHYADFGIPDSRLSSEISGARGVRGPDGVFRSHLGGLEGKGVEISAFPGFWTISVHVVIGGGTWLSAKPNYGFMIATREEWGRYQAKARELLATVLEVEQTAQEEEPFEVEVEVEAYREARQRADGQCAVLKSLGIDARVLDRGPFTSVPTEIFDYRTWDWSQRGESWIEIADGPIRWVVVSDMGGAYYVPDPRIGPKFPVLHFLVGQVRVKWVPMFGPVKTVRWKLRNIDQA